jgi:NitT/TauT family transport system ATP-binding protein
MGTQPGRILDVIELDFPRPREQAREELVKYEDRIKGLLKSEIDKVIEKEQQYATSR